MLKSTPHASHPIRCDTQLCQIWYGKGQLAHSAVASSDSGSQPKVTATTCALPPNLRLTLGCQKWAAFPTQFARGIFLQPSTVAAVTPNLSALPGIVALANRFSSLAHNQHWGAGRHIGLPTTQLGHTQGRLQGLLSVQGSKVGQLRWTTDLADGSCLSSVCAVRGDLIAVTVTTP